MLAINSGYDIPRNKFNARIGWEFNDWDTTLYASRLGKIPSDENFWYQDWDEDYLPEVKAYLPATWRYNASVGYRFRSEAHTSELQSLMRISYAVFCLKKKKTH